MIKAFAYLKFLYKFVTQPYKDVTNEENSGYSCRACHGNRLQKE